MQCLKLVSRQKIVTDTSLSYDLVLVSDSYSDYEIEDDNPVVCLLYTSDAADE